ncbi:TetR/AcrR family transcriptional regulator [Algiphilus sp.]|uniref:TetR/AcrR family transcriptional regulator n=1 Tax=Algiphilus sp. TaxID=1872431 RepID=UPI002A64B3EE|nr:TetR/AcrR family transcriptional regulator [Pseudomonadota bacterium]
MNRRPSSTRSRRYRGRSTDELRAERRERLMQAATTRIGTEGYQSTTIEKLCTEARVSTRHFYEHFATREALLSSLFDRITEQTRAVIMQALAEQADDPVERALNAVGAFVRYALADPARARIAFVETVGVSPHMERRRRLAINDFVDVVSNAGHHLAEQGVLPRRHYRLAAIALVGATNEMLVEWLSGDTGLTAEQMERAIIDLFSTLIAGARASHAS